MATVAKGMITLSVLNDAFSVSLSPNSCVINADFQGATNSTQLKTAFTNISVCRGDTPVKFTLKPYSTSNSQIKYSIDDSTDGYTKKVQLTELPIGLVSGELAFEIDTLEDYHTIVTFQFTVIKESSMLDWIQDWNGRRTQINETSIITPKAFFGTKDSQNRLNGVFIGPDSSLTSSSGIYAYQNMPQSAMGNSEAYEIFRLNKDGGMIGGWLIGTDGISKQYNTDSDKFSSLEILSEGTLKYTLDDYTIWALYKDGTGVLAKGNITWKADGSATFNGKITAEAGQIGGWNIGEDHIMSGGVVLDSDEMLIGVVNQRNYTYTNGGQFVRDVMLKGGVYMNYSDTNEYGICGYSLDRQCVFRLGSTNQIAGWNFDNTSLWIGSKLNTAKQYTSESGSITIGSNGIRGAAWYIDSDGEASFASGIVHFGIDGGKICGWSLRPNYLLSDHIALVSDSYDTGIYLSVGDFSKSALTSFIHVVNQNGGIYMTSDGANTKICGYSKLGSTSNAKRVFLLNSHGECQIGNWYFTDKSLYIGTQKDVAKSYTDADGSITLGNNGIRGYKWYLDADGGGSIAGGNIVWDADGQVTLSNSVTMSWSQITGTDDVMTKGTYIGPDGIFTGKIDASKITTGTLSAARINADELLSNGSQWALKQDGSGYLAGGNITWTKEGTLSVQQAIMKNVRINGTIRQPWSRSGVYVNLGDGENLTFDNIATGETGGWGDGSVATMLTWTLQDSGRIVRLANWKWGSETFDGDVTITAPEGKYFFEDGVAKKKLIFSREIVELIGYADSSTFYGWVVVNRVNFSTRARYGRQLRCLAMGTVIENGTTAPTVKCCTFDGTTISVSKLTDKNNDGIYKVSLPAEWNLEADGYQVMLTGLGEGLMKTTLASRTATECIIHVSDDASRNNGSFQFQIFNTNDWIG